MKEIKKDKIFKLVEENYPVHISEIMDNLEIFPDTEIERQRITNHIRNNFKELSKDKKIVVEDFGQSMVAWPIEIKTLKGKEKILF